MNKAEKHNAMRAKSLGYEAAKRGKPITDNPYKTRRVMGLSSWWEAGWKEGEYDYQEEIRSTE